MNIVIPYCASDKDQVARLLPWIEELGALRGHRLFLMPAQGVKADFAIPHRTTILEDSYGIVSDWGRTNMPVRSAAGPNSMIRQIAWHFYLHKLGFWFFHEPDAIPLTADAYDKLEEEYRRERKFYMGAFVPGMEGEYPDHMTGVAIYPQDTISCKTMMLPTMANVQNHTGQVELAFDVAAAEEIFAIGCHRTKLIQHVFRGPAFRTREDLKRIDPEAVIWHTDKDGGLIDLLRVTKRGVARAERASTDRPDAGSSPAIPAATSDTPTNIVYTYYQPIEGRDKDEQEWLLSRWAGTWVQHGWIPKVIGIKEVQSHPFYDDYKKLVKRLPTVNMREYEEACWFRWLSMVQVGGGLMTDYDVFNYGFTPAMAKTGDKDLPNIIADKNPCPCAVIGTAQQYANAINVIMTLAESSIGVERGVPHLSDQSFVQKHAEMFLTEDICFQHGRAGSDSARLVHYSHSSCQGRSRVEVIPAVERMRAGAPEPQKPLTETDHIKALVLLAKKSGINKGRITKRLRDAGFAIKK
jgi:hypothetical protein